MSWIGVVHGKEGITHTLALLPKGKQAGILLWGFGGEVRGEDQGGDEKYPFLITFSKLKILEDKWEKIETEITLQGGKQKSITIEDSLR